MSVVIVSMTRVIPDTEPAVDDTELHVGITGRPSRSKRNSGHDVL
jgi:hypothetical protein